MYPPGPYAVSRGSFQTPVNPPATDPFDSPKFQICVNEEWLPFIAGALKQLLLQSTWVSMSDADLDNLQGRVFNLISAFGQIDEGCGLIPPIDLCISGDFASEDYGFVADPAAPCPSVYNAGAGWVSCHDSGSNSDYLQVIRVFDQSTFVRTSTFRYNVALLNTTVVDVYFYLRGVQVFHQNGLLGGGGNIDFNSTVNQQADEWRIVIHRTTPGGTNLIGLLTWGLCYTGDFPLAENNTPWVVHKDFTANNGGFNAVVGGDGAPRARYISGTGWRECNASICTTGGNSEIRITKTLAASHRFTAIRFVGYDGVGLNDNHAFNFNLSLPNTPIGSFDLTQLCDLVANNMRFDISKTGGGTSAITLTDLYFTGVGAFPADL